VIVKESGTFPRGEAGSLGKEGIEMKRKMRSSRVFLVTVVVILGTILATTGISYAIINGEPDGNGHPYVGAVHNNVVFCSGSAISPYIFVTAAHCFNYPGEQVWVTFDPEPFAPGKRKVRYFTGSWYPHPDACLGCGPGLEFDTNDVAVVVLHRPVSLPEYAQLPEEGLVDNLEMGTEVTIVGYGAQYYQTGGGPREPVFLRARYYATANLITSDQTNSEEYIKLSQNPAQENGGFCFGDSGGPDLLEEGGTATILAVNSWGNNENCTGVGYSNRIDTKSALDFILSFF
jgi:secreted trypsin-like serine protease